MISEDLRDSRPSETLLLTYARMLNGDDQELLEQLREYRNDLLQVDKTKTLVAFPDEWRIGLV